MWRAYETLMNLIHRETSNEQFCFGRRRLNSARQLISITDPHREVSRPKETIDTGFYSNNDSLAKHAR